MKKPQKKPAAKKKPLKKSKVKNDTLRAFQLVCALIVISIGISFAVITAYNNSNKIYIPAALTEENLPLIDTSEQIEQPDTPQVSVLEEPNRVPVRQEPESPPVRPSPPQTTNPAAPPPAITSAPQNTTSTRPVIPVIPDTVRSAGSLGSVAFVIDDAGNNLQELEPFLRIDGPLTIAVLPGLPYSAEAARRIRAAGKEVILHQPMEALGGQNPGPGGIYSNMSASQIRSILEKNIEEIGPVAGMNNHQGSKITMDKDIMEVILSFCLENNLYFLDSRTTAETTAPAVALRMSMKIAERDAFLDNEQNKESMQRYLSSGLARAQRNGSAVMIGHTWSPALAPLLAEQYPSLIIQGYTIKTVSDLLK